MSTFPLKIPKLRSLEALEALKDTLHVECKKVVLTNGCFDLLHPGHIQYLQAARLLGDQLWIGLNSDESIKSLKSPNRPIYNHYERAYMLSALECVSAIFIFHNLRLTDELIRLKPHIYTKAGDYTLDTLDHEERRALEASNTHIQFMPFLKGYGTTQLIEGLQKADFL